MILFPTVRGWLRRPINLTEMFRALAMFMFGMSALVAVLTFYSDKVDERGRADALAATLAKANGVTTCRAQVASAVTDATTTYLFSEGRNIEAISNLVGALAVGGDIPGALSDLALAAANANRAAATLDGARDARVAFEAKPRGGCTGDSPEVVIPPTTIGPPGISATTAPPVTVRLHRPKSPTSTSATPGTAPGTSSTRPTTTTTTTAPTPLCDLIPDPVTVPRAVPCL